MSRSSPPPTPPHHTPRHPRRRVFAGSLALLIAAAGGAALVHRALAPSPTATAPSASPRALRFTPGTRLHYQVTWSGTQRGRIFAGAQNGKETHATTTVDMLLGLSMTVESANTDTATLQVAIDEVDHHKLHVLGSDVFATREAATAMLTGRRARVVMGTDGTPRAVELQEGAGEDFGNIVQWIVAQSALSLGPSRDTAEWDAEERGPFGASKVHYANDAHAEGTLTRTRISYSSFDAFNTTEARDTRVEKLHGTSTISFRADGTLDRLGTDEEIRVASAAGPELEGSLRFELRLVGVDQAPTAAAVAWGTAMAPGAPVLGEATAAQLLEQRIAGMTREQLMHDVTTYANAGTVPQKTRWLWRATGLLKQNPKLAAELADAALAARANDRARALILDLLASVGHKDAQAAMRKVLSSSELAKSGARSALLQRISFLDAPETETIALARDTLREGKRGGRSDLVYASAHTLASTARAAARAHDPATSRAIVRELGDEVRAATSLESRATLLGSLTNATDPEVAHIASGYAGSEEADLREAAASAVRKVDSPEATAMLLALLGDANVDVQSATLGSLAERKLGESEWGAIAALVNAGRLPPGLDGALLNLAGEYVSRVRGAKAVVSTIAVGTRGDATTRARAYAMLEQSGAS